MASTESREGKLYKLFEEPKHAEIYSKYRPEYPIELKQRVLSYMGENGFDAAAGTSLMLDIGCGTGLVMRLFAPSFTAAWGVDISHEQVKQAVNQSAANQFYLKSPAEVTCFKDNTFDVITAGQAWHWFDHEKINTEVSRILAPNGFFVIFGNDTPFSLSPQLDKAPAILDEFYRLKLAPFYSERIKLVQNRYNRNVWIRKGFFESDNGKCDFSYEMNKLKCPMCKSKVKKNAVNGIGFYNCKLRIECQPTGKEEEIDYEVESRDEFKYACDSGDDDKVAYDYIRLTVKAL